MSRTRGLQPVAHGQVNDVNSEYSRRRVPTSLTTSALGNGQNIKYMIKEAKSLTTDLKTIVKLKDPWDREVEFQRESVRKAYTRIIFSSSIGTSSSLALLASPSTLAHLDQRSATTFPETDGRTAFLPSPSATHQIRLLEALNSLWLETSYSIIHSYRSRIASIEKQLAQNPQLHRQKHPNHQGHHQQSSIPGPTSKRKVIHSFRVFLAKEEEFFATFLGRLAQDLCPNDIEDLHSIGIIVEVPENEARSPEEKRRMRANALPLVHKALICYGDLARYKELYNEYSGPQAKERSGRRGGGAGGKGKPNATTSASMGGEDRRAKNYSRAAECYEKARSLIPDNGYAHDILSSTYHYYRALSVRYPFPTARVNLELAYKKAIAKYFDPTKKSIESFESSFIVLHGLYCTKQRIPDITDVSMKVQNLFEESFTSLDLSSETIIKVVITGLSALWDARLHRSTSITRRSSSKPKPQSEKSTINLEPHILMHVLSLYRILLKVSANETSDLFSSNASSKRAAAPDSGKVDSSLAQNISAIVRRALPGLRIMSNWILGQMDYIDRVVSRLKAKEARIHRINSSQRSTQSSTGVEEEGGQRIESLGSDSIDLGHLTSEMLSEELERFWNVFAESANTFKLVFPIDRMPKVPTDGKASRFEEDEALVGFSPLRSSKRKEKEREDGGDNQIAARKIGKDVHPNEEQLMRIREIQEVAEKLAHVENCPLELESGTYVAVEAKASQGSTVEDERELRAGDGPIFSANVSPTKGLSNQVGTLALLGNDDEDDEDDFSDGVAATEDDPVDLAMRIASEDRLHLTDDEVSTDEDEEDEIVYHRSSPNPGNKLKGRFTPPSVPTPPPGLSNTNSKRNSIDLRAIWGNSPDPLATTASTPNHQLMQLPPPHQGSRNSFEALPNVTHRAASSSNSSPQLNPQTGVAPASIWANTGNPPSATRQGSFTNGPSSLHPQQQLHHPPSYQQTQAGLSLFGHFSPFAAGGSSSHVQQDAFPVASMNHYQPPLTSTPFGYHNTNGIGAYPPNSISSQSQSQSYSHLSSPNRYSDLSAGSLPFVSGNNNGSHSSVNGGSIRRSTGANDGGIRGRAETSQDYSFGQSYGSGG